MSGTGKSTVVRILSQRGLRAFDADDGELSEYREMPGLPGEGPVIEWVWREDRINELLSSASADGLVLSGCASNQGQFYPRFDAIVLLTAPDELLLERLATRTTNPYGRSPVQREEVIRNKHAVEPMLRRRATLEIDTSAPLEHVVATVLALLPDSATSAP
jgi:hypothetical protein